MMKYARATNAICPRKLNVSLPNICIITSGLAPAEPQFRGRQGGEKAIPTPKNAITKRWEKCGIKGNVVTNNPFAGNPIFVFGMTGVIVNPIRWVGEYQIHLWQQGKDVAAIPAI